MDTVRAPWQSGAYSPKMGGTPLKGQGVERPLPGGCTDLTLADPRIARFWERFVATTGVDGPYTAWGFGGDATALGLLVRDGPKRATASLLSWYGRDADPMPAAGDLGVVLDSNGDPCA